MTPNGSSLFVAYAALTFALVITPGATTAVVVRNTLASGWRGGLWAAVGAAIGNSTHATLAGLGLSVLVSRQPGLYAALQVAGGVYLLWLGAVGIRRLLQGGAVPASSAILGRADQRPHHAVREGAWVNLLNPPIITFYLTVVPSFLPTPTPPGYYLGLAATHVGMAFAMHSVWALGLGRLRHVLARPAARVVLEGLTAAALWLLAARVLWSALGAR